MRSTRPGSMPAQVGWPRWQPALRGLLSTPSASSSSSSLSASTAPLVSLMRGQTRAHSAWRHASAAADGVGMCIRQWNTKRSWIKRTHWGAKRVHTPFLLLFPLRPTSHGSSSSSSFSSTSTSPPSTFHDGQVQEEEEDERKKEAQQHVPVMLEEVLHGLRVPQAAGAGAGSAPTTTPTRVPRVFVDGTFGRGGHTRALLERDESCRVVAIDCDRTAFEGASQQGLIARYGDRILPIHGRFGDMASLLERAGVDKVDGILLDLGVSSPQLDTAERGFSFRQDLNGPLDMRMDQATNSSLTAAYVVNNIAEEEIARILYTYGDERKSRQIAKAICRHRKERGSIKTTGELANIVRRCLGNSGGDKIDKATRTFQALRIFVNDEIKQLQQALVSSERLLVPGGRLAIISFHSLEDREVKHFLQHCTGRTRDRADTIPLEEDEDEDDQNEEDEDDSKADKSQVFLPSFRLVRIGGSSKWIAPSAAEVARNPRARSAKLRIAERTQFPPLYPSHPN